MKVLILGGGSVGGKLALDLEDPFVLVEADPSRVWELREMLDDRMVDYQVIHGDGSSADTIEKAGGDFDVVVVLMNRDSENLEAVSVLREMGIPRIIARVNNSNNMYRFVGMGAEVFRHPIGYEEGLIRTMLFPDTNHAIQIFVREGSPAIDRTIRDLGLPEGAVIGSILRDDELIPPAPNVKIRSGDLIAVDTIGKSAKEVWRRFSRTGSVESRGHVQFPLFKDQDLAAVKEVEMLSRKLGSEIEIISPTGRNDLIRSARGFISRRVPIRIKSSVESSDNEKKRWGGKSTLVDIMEEHMKEGSPHMDIIVLPGPRNRFLYMPFIPTNIDRIIAGAPMPVLIARSRRKYRNILIFLHTNCVQEISIAIRLSRAMGSRITALYQPRNSRRVQYLKRFAQVYRVKVEDRKIVGNPTVEIIREIRENHYDLVIIKKDLKNIQRSQLRRLVHLWTGSILLVP